MNRVLKKQRGRAAEGGWVWLLAAALALDAPRLHAEDAVKPLPENPFPRRVPAVELEGGVEWLNAAGPISLKELRGKVVLLDFWTFCCINCMHVLPDLEFLEQKYGKELVVIGVHSAKFDNEKETGNIRKAILRYDIAHPVINDAEMVVWRKYGVRAWPTLVLIDPEGFYCGHLSGEGHRELLDEVLTKVVAYHKAKGTLDPTPVRFDLERHRLPDKPLRFPGKVLADGPGNRLFISDSNHHRIVVTTLDGVLQDVIGAGAIGANDGPYDQARFDHPQGVALVGETLYIADTENHRLRTVDLATKTVSTLAGTGEQGNERTGAHRLREVALNSPWDVIAVDDVLYIAMAGAHQIWSHKLGSETIQPYAGSGREDIQNGDLADAALAQPSGLASDGRNLFVVDSEGSAVRQITTRPNNNLRNPTGTVTTLVGTSNLPGGRSLFEFGDVDGVGSEARLQHPLGITFHNGGLFIADSYNHKLKQVNLARKSSVTWLGIGKPGDALDPPELAEPAGLSSASGRLFVADTNNHRIAVIDLQTKQASELTIRGLTPPIPPSGQDDPAAGQEAVMLDAQPVLPGDAVEFAIAIKLPAGYKLNPEAPATYRLQAVGEQTLIGKSELNDRQEAVLDGATAKIRVPLAHRAGKATVQLALTYAYCRDGANGLCKLGTAVWQIPLEVSPDAATHTVRLTAIGK